MSNRRNILLIAAHLTQTKQNIYLATKEILYVFDQEEDEEEIFIIMISFKNKYTLRYHK